MKTFIYTCSEKWDGACTQKTVALFRVARNKPELIAEVTKPYIDEFHLAMFALECAKALPASAFVSNSNGSLKYGADWLLKEAGIADVIRI
jgi:hypothetical protein